MGKILITGAQFKNKGAQSLLLSFISEVRERFPQSEFFYLPLDAYNTYERDIYNFNIVYHDELSHLYESGGIERAKAIVKRFLKQCAGKSVPTGNQITELSNCLENADLLVDLSGYQLGSKWSLAVNKRYLRHLNEAYTHKIPVILFPQSFGPFEYKDNQSEMDKLIGDTLSKATIIYAREKDGYNQLISRYHLNNVKLSPDSVLQSSEIKWEHIWREKPNFKFLPKKHKKAVGIVPNFQSFVHGNEDTVLSIYKSIIDNLLKLGRNIVIFRHSNDLEICRKIYALYENPNVQLIDYDFSCLEYGEYIKSFDFIVAARYHAVVHAYKSKIPAIVLGWAIKYRELTNLFEQTHYCIDTAKHYQEAELKEIVNTMDQHYLDEKSTISKKLSEVLPASCYEEVFDIISRKG